MKRSLFRSFVNFLAKEDGPTAVECAMLLAIVVVICLIVVQPGSLTLIKAGSEPVVATDAE